MSDIVCSNCGATFDEKEAKCPFCGYISYPGAEEKFMKDLDEIKDNLSDLSSIPKQEYKKEMSKQKKIVIQTIIIVSVIASIIGIICFICHLISDSYNDNYDVKEEMIWERENFPKLDVLYEAENYDAILEFQSKLYQTENNHSLYNWKHYSFIQAYEKYKDSMDIIYYIDMGMELSKYDREDIVYYSMWYHYKQYEDTKDSCSEEEYNKIIQYRDEMEQIFYNHLKFTDKEADDLYIKCEDNGYLNSKPCYQYANKIYKRFK